MRCLIVIAHPLSNSLCQTLAKSAIQALRAAGHEVMVENLYDEQFSAPLSAQERGNYYRTAYPTDSIAEQVKRLQSAEALILCFPTWWFGFPAILKGWFDRVWVPGVAYDHANDLGAIQPRLHQLKRLLAITSLGSPWWVDKLLMRQPVKRVLKTAILGTCAPQAKFEMLSIHGSEKLSEAQVSATQKRITRALARW
jgi:NAD(P)H dehydrogenase (quinone)